MLDLKILTADPRRWLCTECDAEGRGRTPQACPACGGERWYESALDGKDPRTMREILIDLLELVADIQRHGRLN